MYQSSKVRLVIIFSSNTKDFQMYGFFVMVIAYIKCFVPMGTLFYRFIKKLSFELYNSTILYITYFVEISCHPV